MRRVLELAGHTCREARDTVTSGDRCSCRRRARNAYGKRGAHLEVSIHGATLLTHLADRDRALFAGGLVGPSSSRVRRTLWTIITHLGRVWCSILAAAIPLAWGGPIAAAARQTLGTLVLSHIGVQVAFPAPAVPLLAMAFLVGASRVFLGVHYPGDVLVGQ